MAKNKASQGRLAKILGEMADSYEDFVWEKAHACRDYHDLLTAPKSTLPPVAVGEGWETDVAKARLAGRDADTPRFWKAVLESVPCDSIEESNAFAWNNGALRAVAKVAREYGLEDVANRADALVVDIS